MADKFIYIPNYDTQNYPSCRLVEKFEHLMFELNESTNQKLLEFPKLLSKRMRKHYKPLGTSVINSLISPLSLSMSFNTKGFIMYYYQQRCGAV